MGKLITGMTVGFLIGMKCKEGGKTFCKKRLKKQAMKLVGL